MATEIQLKRSFTSGSVPGAANVLVGEPVLNLADRLLYTKDNTGNVIVISSGFAGNIASLAFEAANVAASYTVAGVAGNVSNIQLASGITTSGLLTTANISELTNLYFTNARSRASISIASGNVNGKGSYDSSTGILSINAANVTVSTSAPINPNIGDVWIQADTATEYLFFSDGDTFQWVETGLAATSSAGTSTYGDSNVALLGYATNANVALKANVADLKTANVAEVTNLYFTNARATSAVTNSSLSNITVSGSAVISGNITSSGLITSSITGSPTNTALYNLSAGNTFGGTGYADVIKLTNTSGGSTNPNKYIRLNSSGSLEVINSAYLLDILTLTDTGALTVRNTITSNGFTVGYLEIPQNAQSTSYTLATADSGKHIYSQNTATQVITIPTNANVAFSVGTAISIVLQGSGSITVSPFSGVTLYLAGNSTSASRTISTYGMATLLKVATNTWFINGSGVT
jgi:hypothetical protein